MNYAKSAILLLSAAVTSAFAGFQYEVPVTVSGYTGADALPDFPLLVKIPSSVVAGRCQSDGKDIQFVSADGATVYPHEIDEWDPAGESLAWVKVPLSANLSFTMKFGDPSATDSYENKAALWNGYYGVYHMNEHGEQEGTTDYTAFDSSPLALNLTAAGTTRIAEMTSITGAIGRGRNHSNAQPWSNCNRLYNTSSVKYNLLGDTFVASGWFRFTQRANSHYMMGRKTQRSSNDGGWLIDTSDSGLRIHGSTTSQDFAANSLVTAGEWLYVTVVYNGTSAKVYANGLLKTTGTLKSAAASCTKAFSVGCNETGGTASLNGAYDEIRLFDFTETEPSAARIAAEYANMTASDYVVFGTVSEIASGNTLTVTGQYGNFGTVTPSYGVSSVSTGTVTCTAEEGVTVVSEDMSTQITGWVLTVTDAGGAKRTTSGTGRTCEYVHEEGCSDALEWQMAAVFRVSATPSEAEAGTVSGAGNFAGGSMIALSATANSGYRFVGWLGDLPAGISSVNPIITFTVTSPLSLTAVFAPAIGYTFVNANKTNNAYNWSDPLNWLDIDGDGDGDIPPNDGTATVTIDCSANAAVQLDYGETKVNGLYFKGAGQFQGQNWNGRYFNIGSGGINGEPGAKMPSFGAQGCKLSASQVWHLKSNGITSSKIQAADDIVLVIAGPYTTSLTFTGFNGTLRTNVGMSFPATAKAMEVFNSPGTDGVTESITMNEGIYKYACSADGGVIATPVSFDITNDVPVTVSIGNDDRAFSWIYDFSGALTGQTALDGSSTLLFKSAYPTILSDVGRVIFSGSSAGLTNMTLRTANVMLELAAPGAAFTDPSNRYEISGAGSHGHLGCLILGDGVNLAGELHMNPYRQWNSSQLADAQIAMNGPGEVNLYGNIVNTNEVAYYRQSPNLSAGQLEFYTPTGAVINVRGAISGASVYPVRILGDGDVVFHADNSAMVQGPLVQSGTLRLADNNAAGTGVISVGAPCPSAQAIAAMTPMNNTERAIGTLKVATQTYSGLKKSMFDNYQPVAGDTVLLNFHTGVTGLFHLIDDTTFEVLPAAEAGSRVTVENGDHFGGCSFFAVNGATTGGIWQKESAKAEPDAAVLTQGAVTIANDIIVADNKSAGTRTIGGATADISEFAGNILLSNAVTFAAADGGTVKITGTVSEPPEECFDISFAGLGKVAFARPLDLTGRRVTVTIPSAELPEKARVYTVASGIVGGAPESLTIVSGDTETTPAAWRIYQANGRIVFASGHIGTKFVLQ